MPRFQLVPHRITAEFAKKCMIDNIRNKAIFEIKIAQNLPKLDILQNLILTLHNRNVFASTTKKSGVSIFYSYRDLAWTKHKFKKCFFLAKTSTFYFFAKFNFIFLLHNFSRYVIYGFFFHFFSMKGSWRYGSDKGSVTHGHTDGRTYTEGRTIYVSHRGRHIIPAVMRQRHH